MNKYCEICEIACDDYSNFKRHTQRDRHIECAKNRKIYEEYHTKARFIYLVEQNFINIQAFRLLIQGKTNQNINIFPKIIKCNIDVLKKPIDVANHLYVLCNTNFMIKEKSFKIDIYFKRFVNHFNNCKEKQVYSECIIDDLLHYYVLLEQYNALREKFEFVNKNSESSVEADKIIQKNIDLEIECSNLKKQCSTLTDQINQINQAQHEDLKKHLDVANKIISNQIVKNDNTAKEASSSIQNNNNVQVINIYNTIMQSKIILMLLQ